MAALGCEILLVLIAGLVVTDCSAFLSDFVKEFRFVRRENQTNEFNFTNLEEDTNETSSGKAVSIKIEYAHYIYFIQDNNGTLYWTDFGYNELNTNDWELFERTTEFIGSVRIVERQDDELRFADDFSKYKINLKDGRLYTDEYSIEWDSKNVCFKKLDDEIEAPHRLCSQKSNRNAFRFTILSENNSNVFDGTTCIQNEDIPNVQRLLVCDDLRCIIYEIEFTSAELHSNGTFCRGNIKRIGSIGNRIQGPERSVHYIQIDVLISMVGGGGKYKKCTKDGGE